MPRKNGSRFARSAYDPRESRKPKGKKRPRGWHRKHGSPGVSETSKWLHDWRAA